MSSQESSEASVCGKAVDKKRRETSKNHKLSKSASKQLEGCLKSACNATQTRSKPEQVQLNPCMESLMAQVQHGAELASSTTQNACTQAQEFLVQRWESHKEGLVAAEEALGKALGSLSKASLDQLPAAVARLYKDWLRPEVTKILQRISSGHLKLTNPDVKQREELTSTTHNAITAAHVLVSALIISGLKVAEGGPEPHLENVCETKYETMLHIMNSSYDLSSAVTHCGKAKLLRDLNILFEQYYTDDKIMSAHAALMRRSFTSANAWEKYQESLKENKFSKGLGFMSGSENMSLGANTGDNTAVIASLATRSGTARPSPVSAPVFRRSLSRGCEVVSACTAEPHQSRDSADKEISKVNRVKRSASWIDQSIKSRTQDYRSRGHRKRLKGTSIAAVKTHYQLVPRMPAPKEIQVKMQKIPSKRSVLKGRCPDPENIIKDTPCKVSIKPSEIIPETDVKAGAPDEYGDLSNVRRRIDFGMLALTQEDLALFDEPPEHAQPLPQGTIFQQY